MNEFLTTFHSHANMIDYCEDFIHTEKHDGVFLDRTRFEQTGEDVVFSADSEAELIYCTNGLLGFCLTVYVGFTDYAENVVNRYFTRFNIKDFFRAYNDFHNINISDISVDSEKMEMF